MNKLNKKNCVECNKTYQPEIIKQTLCSDECYNEYHGIKKFNSCNEAWNYFLSINKGVRN